MYAPWKMKANLPYIATPLGATLLILGTLGNSVRAGLYNPDDYDPRPSLDYFILPADAGLYWKLNTSNGSVSSWRRIGGSEVEIDHYSNIAYYHQPPPSAPEVAIFCFYSISVPQNVVVLVHGSRPAVLLARYSADIQGRISSDGGDGSESDPGAGGAGGGFGGRGGQVIDDGGQIWDELGQDGVGPGGGDGGAWHGLGGTFDTSTSPWWPWQLGSGSGGGGGGADHWYFGQLRFDQPGGGAGGGGGGIEIGAGAFLSVSGTVTAMGGDGGLGIDTEDPNGSGNNAWDGGGGSAGGVRLHGQTVDVTGMINVRGGDFIGHSTNYGSDHWGSGGHIFVQAHRWTLHGGPDVIDVRSGTDPEHEEDRAGSAFVYDPPYVIVPNGAEIRLGLGTIQGLFAETAVFQGLPFDVDVPTFDVEDGTLLVEDIGPRTLSIGGLTGEGHVVISPGAELAVGENDNDTTYSGDIGGSGELWKVGNGTLTLEGYNNHLGGTTIRRGVLAVGNGDSLGNPDIGQMSFDGGTVRMLASFDNWRWIYLDDFGGTIDTNGFNTWMAGFFNISGPGQLKKTGAGRLRIGGTPTTIAHTGGMWIDQGVLEVSSDAGLGDPSGPLTFSGGTLSINGYDFVSARVVTFEVEGGTIKNPFNATFTGELTGDGGFTKIDTGILELTHANSYLGPTTINDGELRISTDANLGAPGTTLNLDDAGLRTMADIFSSRPIVIGSNGARLNLNTHDSVHEGGITGSGDLTIAGPGSFAIRFESEYGGDTIVDNATLMLDRPLSSLTCGDLFVGYNLGGVVGVEGRGELNTLTTEIGRAAGYVSHATVQGPGSQWTNSGSVYVGGSRTATGGTGELVIDSGALVIVGSILRIWGPGTVTLLEGSLEVDTIDHMNGGQFDFDAGRLRVGTFEGNLVNSGGVLDPGDSSGRTDITGNYTQSAGELEIDISGAESGHFDVVHVNGVATLDGSLTVRLVGGFEPTYEDSFTILTAGYVNGVFANAPSSITLDGGAHFDVIYSDNAVTLTHYDRSPRIIYVDAGVAGGNDDGTSWSDAFRYLQDALADALAGDQIWVVEGTYKPDQGAGITSGDRDATFQLKNGMGLYGGFAGSETHFFQRDWRANPTVLSGDLSGNDEPDFVNYDENSYHVVTGSGTDRTAVIDGFYITAGSGPVGAGMRNYEGSPLVHNCSFSSNKATDSGAGMINSLGSSPKVLNCVFVNNSADNAGGAMYNNGSTPDISYCMLLNNWALWGGGGLYNYNSSPTVAATTFLWNSSDHWGGGLHSTQAGSAPYITNCLFAGNTAATGGGMYARDSATPTVVNSVFSGNSASDDGGAVYVKTAGTHVAMSNCTLSANEATDKGGGLYEREGTATLDNCILSGNTAAPDSGPQIALLNADAGVSISYSAVEGGEPALYPGAGSITWADGNIAAPVAFVDFDGSDDNAGTLDDDLRLALGSPGVDAGNNAAVPPDTADLDHDGNVAEVTPFDFVFQPRFIEDPMQDNLGAGTPPIVDMGAYERVPTERILYVDAAASGAETGTSWTDAYSALQDALANAAPGDQIWVAEGRYRPDQGIGLTPGDRDATFQLINGVALYGGFAGGEAARSQRDWQAHKAILCGDLNDDDGADFGNYGENSRHVVTGSGTDATAVLDGFTITAGNANEVPYPAHSGGGMYNFLGNPTVTNCTFISNLAEGRGGAMFNQEFNTPITNCAFYGNAASMGGAVYNAYGSSPSMINCVFSGNVAGDMGGAMQLVYSSNVVLINSTFSANYAANRGGALRSFASSPSATNCIFWNNFAPDGPQIALDSSVLDISYSDIQNGEPAIVLNSSAVNWGTSNLDSDPEFVDADGSDDLAGTEDDNLRLSIGYSPCLDRGDNDALSADITVDLDGHERFLDDYAAADGGNPGTHGPPVVDLGAYERRGPVYVDCNATAGNNDGSSWAQALLSLQDALVAAKVGDQIWVMDGVYPPDHGIGQTPGDQNATFQLRNEVAVYGGFTGSETYLWQRDWQANVTILSGDLAANDGPDFTNYDENSYHVVTGSGTNGTAVLDGFTIAAGQSNYGGGMRNLAGDPVVRNCTFRRNKVTDAGAGMSNGSGSSPTVVNCLFEDNRADNAGGGMNNNGGTPRIIGCTFRNNWAYWGGGGLYNHSSSPLVLDSIFVGNTSDAWGGGLTNSEADSAAMIINAVFAGNTAETGGGVYNRNGTHPTLINCLFTGNTATSHGGGMYLKSDGTDATTANCTFSANAAGGKGGGIYMREGAVTVANCILWGNTAAPDSGPQVALDNGTASITYSDVGGGLAGVYPGAGTVNWNDGNISVDPEFRDHDGDDDTLGTLDDDLRLSENSPCIDAGENESVPLDLPDLDDDADIVEPIPADLDDHPRFINDPMTVDTGAGTPPIVDMGAYEYQLAGDYDHDGKVGLKDFVFFRECLGGPLLEVDPACQAGDADRNGRIDLADYAVFQIRFGDLP